MIRLALRERSRRLENWLMQGVDDTAALRRANAHVLGSRMARFVPVVISGLVSVIWLGWFAAVGWIIGVIGLQILVLEPIFKRVGEPMTETQPRRAAWLHAALISAGSLAYTSGWTWSWIVGDDLAVFRAALWFAATLVHALVYFGSNRLFFFATVWPALVGVLATPFLRPGPDYAPLIVALLALHLFANMMTARADKEKLVNSVAKSKAESATAIEASRAKSQFLASMSHELRTPLNAIIGYSEMLKEDAEAEQRARDVADLERIRSSGVHLLHLINDVLDLSKIEAGRMEARLEETDPAVLLREALDYVRVIAFENNTLLDLVLDPNLRPFHSDPVKLRQCVINLASNACKFTQNGRVMVTARFDWCGDARQLRIDVADTGIGMDGTAAERLFEPFMQLHDDNRIHHSGTGLGLALTRRLARLLGGDVSMVSTLGKGSTFTLRVAASEAAAAAEEPNLSRVA
jgi:signal transduction histidine kinase